MDNPCGSVILPDTGAQQICRRVVTRREASDMLPRAKRGYFAVPLAAKESSTNAWQRSAAKLPAERHAISAELARAVRWLRPVLGVQSSGIDQVKHALHA